jgi:hypothetical protein
MTYVGKVSKLVFPEFFLYILTKPMCIPAFYIVSHAESTYHCGNSYFRNYSVILGTNLAFHNIISLMKSVKTCIGLSRHMDFSYK